MIRSILSAVKNRFDCLGDDIAQGITRGDWKRVVRGSSIVLLVIVATVAICLLFLVGMWKFLHSFWGKKLLTVTGGVLLLCLLYASYRENRGDMQKKSSQIAENLHNEVWAENIYGYVRDAVFLVLRAVSDHTDIIMPTSPGMVELPNGISTKDGYVAFNFFARVRKPVNVNNIKHELNCTLAQMARAKELPGIPSDLVLINGGYYCPLQVMNVFDFGDSINIAVAFADEQTVEIAKAYRLLNLDRFRENRCQRRSAPYDEQF